MEHVLTQMTTLMQFFPGADQPIEYDDVDDVEVRSVLNPRTWYHSINSALITG